MYTRAKTYSILSIQVLISLNKWITIIIYKHDYNIIHKNTYIQNTQFHCKFLFKNISMLTLSGVKRLFACWQWGLLLKKPKIPNKARTLLWHDSYRHMFSTCTHAHKLYTWLRNFLKVNFSSRMERIQMDTRIIRVIVSSLMYTPPYYTFSDHILTFFITCLNFVALYRC